MRRKLWVAGVFGLLGAWSCSNTDSPGRPQGAVEAGVGGSQSGGKPGSGGAFAPDGGDSPDASPPGSGGQGGMHTVPPGETAHVTVHGVVRVVDSDGASPLNEPDVTASVDRNGNGKLEAGETVTVTGDDTGAYSLEIDAYTSLPLVISFGARHFSKGVRSVPVKSEGDLTVDGTVTSLEDLSCDQLRCTDDRGTISITGLPEGYTVDARTYDSVNESFAFPGAYADDQGNLLLSGVFSYVSLTDADDEPVSRLDTPAVLRMKVPRTTWHLFTDAHPGNGRIDVPLYSFDELSGQWVADGEGSLEDVTGAPIAEDQLPSVRDGGYVGVVIARAEVTHFSYWNVDWPVATHGCLSFRVQAADGSPATGTVADIKGLTYSGTTGATAGSDGKGCADVFRSEAPGEDLDRNGRPGETHRVSVRFFRDGKVYDGGVHDVGASAATCGESCTDIGAITLDPKTELAPVICTITGVLKDLSGKPVADEMVFATDDAIDDELMQAICGAALDKCDFLVRTGSDGAFSYRVPLFEGLDLFASTIVTEGAVQKLRGAENRYLRCPDAPVELVLDEGYDVERLTVTFADNAVSWTPNRALQHVQIFGSGDFRWWFISEGKTFQSPLVYGELPAGAIQLLPTSGRPSPVVSGDQIEVFGSGITADGFQVTYTGSGTVP